MRCLTFSLTLATNSVNLGLVLQFSDKHLTSSDIAELLGWVFVKTSFARNSHFQSIFPPVDIVSLDNYSRAYASIFRQRVSSFNKAKTLRETPVRPTHKSAPQPCAWCRTAMQQKYANENSRLAVSTSLQCLKRFCAGVVGRFENYFLRLTTQRGTKVSYNV